jgi:hypothetical protein
MSEYQEKFAGFAIVEVMGHQRLAGWMSEQTIAGTGFIRVDVPETETTQGYGDDRRKVKIPAFTQLLGAGSIYRITPCTAEVAKRAAESFVSRPMENLDLTVKSLPEPATPASAAPADAVDPSPWDDPNVKSALKSGRTPADIMLIDCPGCGNAGYYNQGSHFNCRLCGSGYACITENETEDAEGTGRPTITIGDGEEYALADWNDAADDRFEHHDDP